MCQFPFKLLSQRTWLSIHIQISGSSDALSDKSGKAALPRVLLRHLSWENRQNPIHLCHQRHTRSRNSLVLFTPKLKGLINASLYSAQQNGHWTQSAAARRSAAVALLSLSVSAELALLNVSNPQYCRVRQASQTPTLFFSVKLIFSFIVSKLKKSRKQKSGDKMVNSRVKRF